MHTYIHPYMYSVHTHTQGKLFNVFIFQWSILSKWSIGMKALQCWLCMYPLWSHFFPWYDLRGWLGVKKKLSMYLSPSQDVNDCCLPTQPTSWLVAGQLDIINYMQNAMECFRVRVECFRVRVTLTWWDNQQIVHPFRAGPMGVFWSVFSS